MTYRTPTRRSSRTNRCDGRWTPRRAALLALIGLTLAACRADEEPTGLGDRMPVVHAVLNPQAFEQRILAEWLLSGRIDTTAGGAFDDPIRGGAGDPMVGARVTVHAANGDSAVAQEILDADSSSTGVYSFFNGAKPADTTLARRYLQILPGVSYDLRVRSAEGHDVRGTTVLPAAPLSSTFAPVAEIFDREVDSLYMLWSEVPSAARYLVAVESPRAQMRLFVPHNEYLLAGTIRNSEHESAPAVLLPGFEHSVWVAAVDAGYYDYYRSGNDDLTGRGLLSNLIGGVGFFGSMVILKVYRLRVVGAQTPPLGGRWTRETGSSGPTVFDLYLEGTLGTAQQLTGSWVRQSGPAGVIGVWDGQRLRLAFLDDFTFSDTVDVLDARYDGAARIQGTLRSGGTVSYVPAN